MKVSKFSNNHVKIEFKNDVVMLQSYDSPVAIFDGVGRVFLNSPVYHFSRTTAKHVNKFLTTVYGDSVEVSRDRFNELMQNLCHD